MKILIVIPSFRNGGTNTSLKNLVSQLDISRYQIDVYAITNIGYNREYIAKYVNVLGTSLDNDKTKLSFKVSLSRTIIKMVKCIKKGLEKLGFDISPILFKSEVFRLTKNNYNLIIAFQEGQATRFVSYFKNIRKVAWIRCDYSNMLRISKIKPQYKLYSKIDQIICVSEYTKNVFVKIIPEAKTKTIALHNLISFDIIIQKSRETKELDLKFSYNGYRIVSLGRIDPVKRFTHIPAIVSELKKRGYIFKWYILGEGDSEEMSLILKKIKFFNVEENLILLGAKNNPYPYIKNADLLVSTSLSEACPNVIIEAKILETPVVSSDFGSVSEFIDNNENGLISPIESIADKVEIMISNKKLYDRIKYELSNINYSNDQLLDVWYNKILIK